jgi:hypothetical protein
MEEASNESSSYERKNADDRAIAPKGLQDLAQG